MSSMEFPTRMSPTRAQRRQNTSCDRCRRSKRRCTLSPRTEGDSVICSTCRRLGHTCTFDFVNSRMRSVPQRKQKQTLADSSQFDEAEQRKSVTAAEAFTISNDDYQLDSIADPDSIDSWLNFDHGPFYDNNLTYLSSNIISPAILGSTTATPDDNPVSTQSTRSDATSRPSTHPVGLIVGGSLTSPIHLLSSRLDASILDDRLARIYDTIITGCSSRFLDSDCNLYTEDGKYKLEDGPAKMSLQSISNPGQIATGDVLGPQHIGQMTTLGIARFLDHFSDLYGNSMTPATRRQSERILSSVLRTFALQWMPSESPDKTHLNDSTVAIFTDSWFRSRSLLKVAQSLRSYRLLYAVLLFDAIAIPAKAAGSVSANEFLDAGLQNLCYLDGLVKQYCENLGPESKYRSLLEASLNIIRWGAYIRDTGASLTANRECKLPDVVSQMNGTLPLVTTEYASRSKRLNLPASSKDETIPHSIYRFSYRDLDRSIPNIYRKAFAEAFFVWRQIINTKNNLNKMAGSVSMLSMGTTDAMISAMNAVSEFNQWFRPFMSHCVKTFKHLSIGSKTYSGTCLISWITHRSSNRYQSLSWQSGNWAFWPSSKK